MAFLEIIELNGESKLYNLEDLTDQQFITVIREQADKFINGFSTDPLRKQPELFPIKE